MADNHRATGKPAALFSLGAQVRDLSGRDCIWIIYRHPKKIDVLLRYAILSMFYQEMDFTKYLP